MLEQIKREELQTDERSVMKRNLYVICALTIALIVTVAAAVVFLPRLFGGQKASHRPMLVKQGNDVYMLNGDRKVRLGSTDELSQDGELQLQCMAAHENGDLYYLKNFDKAAGTGDLMAVRPGGPLLVTHDVYAAAAGGGGRALFLQNVENGSGDLYLAEPGKLVTLVDKSVIPDVFGFSPNGERYYYTVRKGDTFAIYEGSVGSKANLVHEDDAAAFRFVYFRLADDGHMMVGTGTDVTAIPLRYYKDGEFEVMGMGIQPVAVFDSLDEFLFMRMEDLKNETMSPPVFYKAPGQEPVCVCEGAISLSFDDYEYPKKTFVFTEGDRQDSAMKGERGVQAKSVMSSVAQELTTGTVCVYNAEHGKTVIGEVQADSSISISSGGNGIAVMQYQPAGDGSLLMSRKAEHGYTPLEKIDDTVWQYKFDDSGNYLYWVTTDYVLKRCDIEIGQIETLMEKVMKLWVIEDTLYVCEDGSSIYRWYGDEPVKLHRHANDVTETSGGVYVTTLDNEIVFYAHDNDLGETMCSDIVQLNSPASRFKYTQLTDKIAKTLRMLYEDACFYMGRGEGKTITKPHGTAQEDLALALSLVRGTYPEYAHTMVHFFCEGFNHLAEWDKDKTNEELQRQALNELGAAISVYERYIGEQ